MSRFKLKSISMQKRTLGKTNFQISEIALGTWQVGGKWGDPFSDKVADGILNTAIDAGVNFIDTADVYSAGLSEKAVGRVVKSRSESVYVATKCGRQITPHLNEGYTEKALRGYVEDSLRRTGLETLNLIQLHCPPTEVYYRPEIFGLFERLKEEGKIQHLGVSVEKVEEALKGMQYDNVTTVQIIFNVFRQRPSELFFREASARNVRHFNRDGAGFDKGETFSGVDYDLGLAAMEEMKALFPTETNLAPRALQWILRFTEVSCIIPGASKIQHLNSNLSAPEMPPLTERQLNGMNEVYVDMIKAGVHQLW